MDQKPGNIDQDVRDIVETRAAISQKLELLRQRARYTVDASKASVDHLITHVRDTAQGVLDRAKQGVDPIHLVRAHPWAMVGGALAAGFVLGRLESQGFFSQQGAEPSGERRSRSDLRHQVEAEISRIY